MSKGVEHNGQVIENPRFKDVNGSEMSEGVEHIKIDEDKEFLEW